MHLKEVIHWKKKHASSAVLLIDGISNANVVTEYAMDYSIPIVCGMLSDFNANSLIVETCHLSDWQQPITKFKRSNCEWKRVKKNISNAISNFNLEPALLRHAAERRSLFTRMYCRTQQFLLTSRCDKKLTRSACVQHDLFVVSFYTSISFLPPLSFVLTCLKLLITHD